MDYLLIFLPLVAALLLVAFCRVCVFLFFLRLDVLLSYFYQVVLQRLSVYNKTLLPVNLKKDNYSPSRTLSCYHLSFTSHLISVPHSSRLLILLCSFHLSLLAPLPLFGCQHLPFISYLHFLFLLSFSHPSLHCLPLLFISPFPAYPFAILVLSFGLFSFPFLASLHIQLYFSSSSSHSLVTLLSRTSAHPNPYLI